jgi:hypothetical protein
MPQEEPKTKGGGTFIEAVKDSLAAAGRYAMLGALDVLATTPISTLRGHKLEAEDFDRLMVGDTVRDLLAWIGTPKATREGWDAPYWSAFCSRCREEFEFDPVSEGDLVAAERLGARKGAWAEVWRRFTESPGLYPGVPDALRRAKPDDLFVQRESWPQENEKDEKRLRAALLALNKATLEEVVRLYSNLNNRMPVILPEGHHQAWLWFHIRMI